MYDLPYFSKWFKGKTALVTGATSGIGREIAKLLVQYGCKVVPCGRDKKAMDSLSEELNEISTGSNGKGIIADFSNDESLDNLINEVKQDHNIDILVNNAGFGYMSDFYIMPQDKVDSMQRVNMSAVVIFCQTFLPRMIEKSAGGILNIGSTASFFATPGSAVYGATKHFILAFTDALHEELLSFNIHVTGVYPGHTESRFVERATGGRIKNWQKAMNPRTVAYSALEGLSKNRTRIIPGIGNKIRVLAASYLPSSFIMKKIYTGAVQKYRD